MSLAGRHGEAACLYCQTLVDLREDRKLVHHKKITPIRQVGCPGSYTYAHTAKRELEELAFKDGPRAEICPGCDQEVVINTIGLEKGRERWSAHTGPAGNVCQRGGTLVSDVGPGG